MIVKAYAKINLSLDILGKRADGYHLLDMVMHSVSLCDTLTLTEKKEGVTVSCDREEIPCGPENTVYRAAEAFYQYTKLTPGIRIAIDKQIPSQAGLAGGSADAAAVLRALNRMYQTDLPLETLCEIALTVGADVPFCVVGGAARVQGIGEKWQPVAPLPDCRIVICKPPLGVNTAEAYAKADEQGGTGKALYTKRVLQSLEQGALFEIGNALGNAFSDLLPLPEVDAIRRQMLRDGAAGSCMTGSGSAVYGLFAGEDAAEQCRRNLLPLYPETFLCRPIRAYP
ncbi:4-(cytidine 5'-diphospho)-2-C-methyl-D-erythritol kinase [Clostridium sp. D33t1_170424_F3]|uniref:4-(cytidine 5'-diphospho)-2-C-methyl-D-erythritol kinase n=1 Tax=Clostridium sp. D33t1_170424_F3 TaxID=2787099 RepID=UPI0018AA21FB|nr:4-(cytidine 5'-diphospho)-2-C-methyl-D-erythritol kinase [Clostridium sp. D33t1_170424_F3]